MNRIKILIVDDEYWSISPLIDRLETTIVCEITYAENCIIAKRLFQENNFDVVISDLMILNGDEQFTTEYELHQYNGIGLLLEFADLGRDCTLIANSIMDLDEIRILLKEKGVELNSKIDIDSINKIIRLIKRNHPYVS